MLNMSFHHKIYAYVICCLPMDFMGAILNLQYQLTNKQCLSFTIEFPTHAYNMKNQTLSASKDQNTFMMNTVYFQLLSFSLCLFVCMCVCVSFHPLFVVITKAKEITIDIFTSYHSTTVNLYKLEFDLTNQKVFVLFICLHMYMHMHRI